MNNIKKHVAEALTRTKADMSASQIKQLEDFNKFKAALQKAGVYKEDRYYIKRGYGYGFDEDRPKIRQ